MIQTKLHLTKPILALFLCLGVIVATFLFYARSIYHKTEEETSIFMEELARKTSESIRIQLNASVAQLSGLATAFSLNDGGLTEDSLLTLLSNTEAQGDFRAVVVADQNGNVYGKAPEFADVNIGEEAFFQQAMAGNTAVTLDFQTLQGTSDRILTIAVPIKQGEEVFGAVLGQYRSSDLDALLANKFFNGAGYNYIIKSNGEVVASGTETFLSDLYAVAEEFSDFSSADVGRLLNDFEQQKSGISHYHKDGVLYHFYYAPVQYNDWYMMVTVPDSIVNARAQRTIDRSILFAAVVGSAVFVALGFMFYALWKHYRMLQAAYEEIRSVYRTVPIAVLQFQFDPTFPIQQANDAFYRLIGCSQKEYRKRFHNSLIPILNKDDLLSIGDCSRGIVRKEMPLRRADGRILWVYGAFDQLSHTPNQAPLIQCSLTNITDQKHKLETVEESASLDTLTGLKNRAAATQQIRLLLHQSDASGAMLMLDLDNFKNVNDTLGHPQGDSLLKAFAHLLQQNFRAADVVCRLGGDEFLVFMPGKFQKSDVENKLNRLMQAIPEKLDFFYQQCGISVSIGVVLTTGSLETVETLYSHADKALYEAKRSGKNQFQFYDSERPVAP